MSEGIYNVYSEDIEKFIGFVNDLTTEIYYEELRCTGNVLFQCGACYEFVKIMKNFFDIDNILIQNNYNHCAFEYKGNYYDSYGLIQEKEKFLIANEEDILYIEDKFGGHLIGFKIYDTVINELSLIEKVPYLPSKFYQNKLKINTLKRME